MKDLIQNFARCDLLGLIARVEPECKITAFQGPATWAYRSH